MSVFRYVIMLVNIIGFWSKLDIRISDSYPIMGKLITWMYWVDRALMN